VDSIKLKTIIMYQIIVDISNDPISGFQRKVDIQMFDWNLAAEVLNINCLVTFYKGGDPIIDQRFAPYVVTLIANNTPDDTYPNGEYNYFIQQYATNPIVLPTILAGIVVARDQQGRFNV
jgi:hypothetical protein